MILSVNNLGLAVRRARERSGLSRSALTERATTSRGALDQIEKGERVPRVDTFLRLLQATGSEVTMTLAPEPASKGEVRTLASFCSPSPKGGGEDRWVWRSLVSDFVANEFVPASSAQRHLMLATEPPPFGDPRWDCFVAALAEHLAFHSALTGPVWCRKKERDCLTSFWWPVHGELPTTRAAALATSPASFKRRKILVDQYDLPLVIR